MNDIETLRETIDEMAREVSVTPGAWVRLERKARARHRRRVAASAALAIAAVAGAAVAVPRLLGGEPSLVGPADDRPVEWTSSTDDATGWTFEHPASWTLQRFDDQCRVNSSGVLIMNTDLRLEHPRIEPDGASAGGCTTAWDLREVPASFVAVEIEREVGGPFPLDLPFETRFPLSLDDAERTDLREFGYLSLGDQLYLRVVRRGYPAERYAVRVLFGLEASDDDRAIAARIVSSIRPEPGS